MVHVSVVRTKNVRFIFEIGKLFVSLGCAFSVVDDLHSSEPQSKDF